jgi:hypothetical protein
MGSILGCLAVPIIVLLAIALVGFGLGSIGQGVAAASLGLTAMVQSIFLPVLAIAIGALGLAGGIGWGLALPHIQQWRKVLPPGDEERPAPPAQVLLPKIEVKQLPAPSPTLRPAKRRRAAPINLDRRL